MRSIKLIKKKIRGNNSTRMFILRFITCLILVFVAAQTYYGFFQHSKIKQVTTNVSTGTESKLNQHITALYGLYELDGSVPSASLTINQHIKYVRNSTEELIKTEVDTYYTPELKALLNGQLKALAYYESEYRSIEKLIAYVPAADTVQSSPNENLSALKLSITNIEAKASNGILQRDTRTQLAIASKCLNGLKEFISANNSALPSSKVVECTKKYNTARKNALDDLNKSKSGAELMKIIDKIASVTI